MSGSALAEIRAALSALSNPTVPTLRSIRKEWSKVLQSTSGQAVLNLAAGLHADGSGAARFIGAELVRHHPAARSMLNAACLRKFGQGMASWDQVDTFACYLAGPAWRKGQINDVEIRRWANSPDRCWRRAALASTVPLNNKTRGGSGDAKRTLAVCRLLIEDRDDMVVKALSWALRELAKRDHEVVRSFLDKNKHKLAARVVREVGNKLQTGKKNPK